MVTRPQEQKQKKKWSFRPGSECGIICPGQIFRISWEFICEFSTEERTCGAWWIREPGYARSSTKTWVQLWSWRVVVWQDKTNQL